MNRLVSTWVFAALLAVLSGCHPDLDWRELRSQEGGFSLYLPARVFQDARELPIAGQRVRMRQWSARTRDTLFAVGYVDLAPLRPEAFDALRDALVANISGNILSEHELEGASSREIIAAGSSGGAPLMLRLRLIASGERLYQIALLGKPDEVASGDIDFFFQSFRLLKQPDRSAPAAPQPGHPRR
jgi:hypothetical protein